MEMLLADDDATQIWIEDKLVREATLSQLRAHVAQVEAMMPDDVSHSVFATPQELCLRPVARGEVVVTTANGERAIVDDDETRKEVCVPLDQLQREFDIYINVVDRGPTVASAVHFLLSEGYMTAAVWGWFHGQWNGLKRAAKRSKHGKAWNAIRELLVFST